jgi:hypothetical protein
MQLELFGAEPAGSQLTCGFFIELRALGNRERGQILAALLKWLSCFRKPARP